MQAIHLRQGAMRLPPPPPLSGYMRCDGRGVTLAAPDSLLSTWSPGRHCNFLSSSPLSDKV